MVPFLIYNIVEWHYERNLVHGSTDKDQMLKLVQESGELADNLANHLCIKDDIGDMLVVLINLMERSKVSVRECFTQLKSNPPLVDPNGKMGNTSFPVNIIDFLHFESRKMQFHAGMSMRMYLDISADLGVLSDRICKGKTDHYIYFGNIIRDLVILAECNTLTIESCLEQAWNDIKDRKGMMVDGIFVKEADLKTN